MNDLQFREAGSYYRGLGVLWGGIRTPVFLISILSLLIGVLYLQLNGSVVHTVAAATALIILAISFYRLDWGFSIYIGLVLLLDQFLIRGYDTLTFRVGYFLNLKETPYFPAVEWASISAMDLHLFMIIFIWLVLLALRKSEEYHPIAVWPFFLLFAGWIGISFARGVATGGDLLSAVWEVRAFAYFSVIFAITPQIIRNREQVENLMWIVIISIAIKSLQGVSRFIGNGFGFGGAEMLTNGEDPVFFVTLICLVIAMTLLDVKHGQRKLLNWALIPLLLGIYTGQRRSTYISLALVIIALIFFTGKKQRKTLFLALIVFTALFSLYLVLYWDTWGRIGVIAQQFKSIIGQSDPTLAGMDYYSNLYRDYENWNLSTTIQRAPMGGIGFGHPYDTPLKWFAMLDRFAILKYIPHNSILWIFSKSGAIGLFLFLLFFNSFLFKGTYVFKRITDPYLRVICLFGLLAVVNQVVVAYVEMQFAFFRNMIYLGCAMAMVSSIYNIERRAAGE